MQKRFAYGALVFAILVASFAVGFTLVPQTAEACTAHPACPGFGCVAKTGQCGCGPNGDRWEEIWYCRDNPSIIIDRNCTGYICAP